MTEESASSELSAFVASVRELFDAAACSCAMVDAEGERLTFVAADGVGAAAIIGVELPVGRGIAGWAAMSGQPIAVGDVGSDRRFAREVAEQTAYIPTSVWAVPMTTLDGEVIGVVEVLDPGIEASAGWALDVLGTLAWCAAHFAAPQPRDQSDLVALGRAVQDLVDRHGRGMRR